MGSKVGPCGLRGNWLGPRSVAIRVVEKASLSPGVTPSLGGSLRPVPRETGTILIVPSESPTELHEKGGHLVGPRMFGLRPGEPDEMIPTATTGLDPSALAP